MFCCVMLCYAVLCCVVSVFLIDSSVRMYIADGFVVVVVVVLCVCVCV